ncbi:hypothetical protein E2C01_042839 [Portunus trituberculatus]|uniref:Uncharacterized protein n=1 Tax=Portunus trituberculatus TaxID=210409 RepID=A0A5B7FUP4_PORTR|nr:hypothetical protein [Portunus trituberculatus]
MEIQKQAGNFRVYQKKRCSSGALIERWKDIRHGSFTVADVRRRKAFTDPFVTRELVHDMRHLKWLGAPRENSRLQNENLLDNTKLNNAEVVVFAHPRSREQLE